jgi:predicted nucleotidyltransferase
VEPKKVARSVLRERYPAACVGILGETVMGHLRTSSSDLDLVVVQSEPTTARWEGFRFATSLVEAFVADRDSWDRCVTEEVRQRCPVVLRISATGVPVTVDRETTELQEHAADIFAAGPPPVAEPEARLGRRLLADLRLDLDGGPPEAERAFIVEAIARQSAELLLVGRRHWLGRGKWLARVLDESEQG